MKCHKLLVAPLRYGAGVKGKVPRDKTQGKFAPEKRQTWKTFHFWEGV